MKGQELYKLLVVGLLCIIASGCSGQNLTPTSTADISSFSYYSDIQFEDVNQSIKLTIYPPQAEPFRQNYSIDLLIENTSETDIQFPIGWGEKIYQYWEIDASWHEVENRTTYYGSAITLSSKGASTGISIFPIGAITSLTQGMGGQIRIIVSGTTVPDHKPVLAYIDLELQP